MKYIGKVVKKNNKSVFVKINLVKKHKIYKKIIKYSKKFYVHDFKNISNINDLVLIKYFRPISKNKSWVIIKIINKYDTRTNNY